MEYLEAEEMDRLESNPFRSYTHTLPDVHIPKRFRPASPVRAGPFNAHGSTGLSGLAAGGRVPSMNGMNEDQYTTFIREGMDRLRNIKDQHERDQLRAQKERLAEERLRREEADERRRDERRQRRKAAAAAAASASQQSSSSSHSQSHSQSQSQSRTQGDGQQKRTYIDIDEETVVDLVRDSKALERARYIAIWQSLAGVPGEVQQVEMRYKDIPWPIYGGKTLDKANIYTFLSDLASDTTTTTTTTTTTNTNGRGIQKDKEKKVLRDAIRIFHPDRFFGRFLERVRISDRDKVKEGVEVCSRVINALAAENATR